MIRGTGSPEGPVVTSGATSPSLLGIYTAVSCDTAARVEVRDNLNDKFIP